MRNMISSRSSIVESTVSYGEAMYIFKLTLIVKHRFECPHSFIVYKITK